IHCKGKITAENLEVFQREIRDLMPQSRGPIATIAYRIVLDLSNVTHVDSSGLGALLGAWTAARDKGCDLEIANLNPRVEKLVEITKLDNVFKRGGSWRQAAPRRRRRVSKALSLRWTQKRHVSKQSMRG